MDQGATSDPALLWLGYPDLSAPCAAITAIVHYQQAWDRRIIQSYGTVPPGVCCVVLLEDGSALPARRSVDDLHSQWTTWQTQSVP